MSPMEAQKPNHDGLMMGSPATWCPGASSCQYPPGTLLPTWYESVVISVATTSSVPLSSLLRWNKPLPPWGRLPVAGGSTFSALRRPTCLAISTRSWPPFFDVAEHEEDLRRLVARRQVPVTGGPMLSVLRRPSPAWPMAISTPSLWPPFSNVAGQEEDMRRLAILAH